MRRPTSYRTIPLMSNRAAFTRGLGEQPAKSSAGAHLRYSGLHKAMRLCTSESPTGGKGISIRVNGEVLRHPGATSPPLQALLRRGDWNRGHASQEATQRRNMTEGECHHEDTALRHRGRY